MLGFLKKNVKKQSYFVLRIFLSLKLYIFVLNSIYLLIETFKS